MHMADALISPATAGVMTAVSAGLGALSIKKTGQELDSKSIPLMGVMGAAVFAMQMINFTIPATGSSGHIGGGLLLAATLGPYAGFLTMAAVLLIQALFFADGGLMAYGCNLFNLGFFACFLGFMLIYKKILQRGFSVKKIWLSSIAASVIALQLGAFGVVLETVVSGKTVLPFAAFAALMQPIHLAIGLVEGVITAAVLSYIWRARPALLTAQVAAPQLAEKGSAKQVAAALICAALLIGGVVSLFASAYPDGLEWSISKITSEELSSDGIIYEITAAVQKYISFLPDYGFKKSDGSDWQGNLGTSLSGLTGCVILLGGAAILGGVVRLVKARRKTHGKQMAPFADRS